VDAALTLALSLDRERDLEKQERETQLADSHARLARLA
jgi:hypothetical protein